MRTNPDGTLAVNAAGIPPALTALPRWVVWRSEDTKIPYAPDGRRKAGSNRPGDWGEFSRCLGTYRAGGFSGLGFVFHPPDGLCGVDLDGCRDPRTGWLGEGALEILWRLDTYSEISPSGTGVKAFGLGSKPQSRCRFDVNQPGLQRVEVYDRLRWFAVTGLALPGPATLGNVGAPLAALYAERFGLPEARPAPTPGVPQPRARPAADRVERALRYLGRCPPAVSGQAGHNVAFRVARAVVYGFDLGAEVGFSLLSSAWNPLCQPPWSERELRHKCADADEKPFSAPRGYLLSK